MYKIIHSRRYNPYKWHTIDRIPYWVKKRFGWLHDSPKFEDPDDPHGELKEIKHPRYARGRHYEYKVVVAGVGHTHDDIVIRRKLAVR